MMRVADHGGIVLATTLLVVGKSVRSRNAMKLIASAHRAIKSLRCGLIIIERPCDRVLSSIISVTGLIGGSKNSDWACIIPISHRMRDLSQTSP